MMRLNFDKKTNQLLFKSIFVCFGILKVVMAILSMLRSLVKNLDNASLDESS